MRTTMAKPMFMAAEANRLSGFIFCYSTQRQRWSRSESEEDRERMREIAGIKIESERWWWDIVSDGTWRGYTGRRCVQAGVTVLAVR